MFARANALNLERVYTSGRTLPMLTLCELLAPASGERNIVVKPSEGCFRKEKDLVRECVAACFAHALGFNVPTPYLVHMSQEFIQAISDPSARDRARKSNPVAFGSEYLRGFSVPNSQGQIPSGLVNAAAEVFAFDVLVGNTDRRVGKPNCLTDGSRVALIDHEQAFGVLDEFPFARVNPWQTGGANAVVTGTPHIFYAAIKGKSLDFSRLEGVLLRMTDTEIQGYASVVPQEWGPSAVAHGHELVDYLMELRKNAAAAFSEVRRVLA